MKTRPRLLALTMELWRYDWKNPDDNLRDLRTKLQDSGAIVGIGGEYDRWDLQVQGGLFGGSRLRLAVQSYAAGKQLFRYCVIPRLSWFTAAAAPFAILSVAAGLSGSWLQCAASGMVAVMIVIRAFSDAGFAAGMIRDILKRSGAS